MTLKTQIFMNPHELTEFVSDVANNVTTVVAIVTDTASGKYVLFYT